MERDMFMLNTMDRPVNIMAVMFVCIWGNCNTANAAITHYEVNANRSNPVFGNFSITNLQPRLIHLEWDLNVSASVIGFDIFVKPVETSDFHQHRLGSDFSGLNIHNERRSVYEIDGLEPETEYELFVYAISSDGVVGASERIVFRTLSAKDEVTVSQLNAHPIEFIIVISILIAWGVAFGIFVHKWGTIRIIQPRDYRSKHDPKNLHTIKIVSRPTDSVIYRNYSKKYTSTMEAREKKIERMNTMPNIKIAEGGSSGDRKSSPKASPESNRFRDTFIQSDINTAKATTSLTAKQKTPTSTFGTFQLGYRNTDKGLMGMSTSYLDQLRTTANIMLDFDRKAKKSGNKSMEAPALSTAPLSSSAHSFPGRKDTEKGQESEGMRMVTLLKVVEEDEEQTVGANASKKTKAQLKH